MAKWLSYPQGWDLFFFIFLFSFYSRVFNSLFLNAKNDKRSSKIYKGSSRIYRFSGKGLVKFTRVHNSQKKDQLFKLTSLFALV